MMDFGIWIYPLVFLGETMYLLGDSLYLIFLWNKKAGAAAGMGFLRTVIWVIVTSSVIVDVQSDPLKVVCYCLGYVAGVLLAVSIEKRFSNGYIAMRFIVPQEDTPKMMSALASHHWEPSLVPARDCESTALAAGFLVLRRSQVQQAADAVTQAVPQAYIYSGKLSEFKASSASRLTPFTARYDPSKAK